MIQKELLSKAYNLKMSGATWQDLEDTFNIKVATLRDNLKKEGFDVNNLPKNKKVAGKVRQKITQTEIDLAFKLKNEGKTMEEISLILNKPKYTLRILGIHKINKIVDRRQVYKTNINYFDNINTEDKAYFLGLIAADGSVDKSRLRIELQEEDDYIIKMFRDLISPEQPLYYSNRVNKNKTACLTLNSVYWKDKLDYLHIVPRKSFCNTSLCILQKDLMPHFIRGYFDGDGSVYFSKAHNSLRVSFIGNTLFMNELLLYLIKVVSINSVKIRCDSGYQEYTSQFSIARKDDIEKLYSYMYQSSNYYLKRKKNIFDTYYLL